MAKSKQSDITIISKKNTDGLPPTIINQQITVRPINRQPQDIVTWRNATRSAESTIPRRVQLYDLYEDVWLDGHVIAVTNKRIEAVAHAKWAFVDKNGEPVDEINYMIDTLGFEEVVNGIMASKFWGYSMLELSFFKDDEQMSQFSVYDIPKKHMRPETGIVSLEQTGDEGFSIREGIYAATVMEVGKAKDLGLFLSVAQYAIFKRGGFSDWAQFVEVFGQPLIDATWDGFDEKQRLLLLDSLNKIGGGGTIVRPAGTTIDLKENKANADGKLQNNFIDALNKEISKVILGNTETTESSSSSGYAQAETHADVEDKKNESDIAFARRILNSKLRKILKDNGIDTQGGKFIIQGEEEQLQKKDAYQVHKSMATDLNMPIDHDFMYKTYGMEKPKDYEAQIAEKQAQDEQKQAAELANSARTPPASGKKAAKMGGKNSTKPGDLKKLYYNLKDFFA